MAKINISLVGGQPMPIYVGLEGTTPDSLVLVHSSQSENDARTIADICGYETTLEKFSDVDYPQIEHQTQNLLERLSDNDIYVNISGGPKPWSIAFAKQTFQKANVTLFYIDQNNRFINLDESKVIDLHLHLDIATILKYNHTIVSDFTLLNRYTEEDFQALFELKEVRQKHPKDFFGLTNITGWTSEKKGDIVIRKLLRGNSTLSIDKKGETITFSGYDNRGRLYEYPISSPHICEMALNARWFELEVANMISQWPSAIEVWTNVKFPYNDGKAKNEIDVLVSDGNKLLFIECKTQVFDATDVDKFRTATKNYGGTASKALFVTNTKEMKPEVKQKCEDSKIMTFSLGDKSGKKTRESLFYVLDKEMKNTNER